MNYIEKQQLEAMLCTGVPVSTPSVVPKVNMKHFKMVASWLGLMLGLMTGAADMSGHVFLLKQDPAASIQMILSFTAVWSIGVSIMSWVVFALIRQLIRLVMVVRSSSNEDEDDLLKTFENRVLLWAVVGVTFGYTVIDAFFLSAPQFLLSLVAALGSIGIYKILVICLDKHRKEDAVRVDEGTEIAPLMIV
mmetsp:Transcript_27007/g.44977  ORF Transcript_27007/g.44977 Transcript_27007/m.44977 type:complete len:192 (+) Transcript_27007:757-1332(+)|eukprot:CAMPEP_0119005192 /NCGR_PEP_ID=MMETSP1176-20130426/1576_1 /TAXON_ID=265551 /ORGANISM="Synedropsis recta cf, Strain CCMP1620" /LENGTH=191 /DNA_ID=CAMNT_0006956969 /DNA_START=724 /DNA_END=1299 /DNA_ORIENTATION=+